MDSKIMFKRRLKHLHGVEPDAAWNEIERMRAENGGVLHPKLIVESASNEGHLLHGAFTWDDAVAGPKWREQEARALLRNFVIVYGEHQAPAYVHVAVPSDDGGKARRGYMRTDEAMAREDLKMRVIKSALRQVLGMEKRFREIAELGGVWEAARRIADDLEIRDFMR